MANYSYYSSLPAWGTSQFQPLPPPTPRYRPSSSWTGNDYFRAHAGTRDNSVFDYVWYKLRDFVLGTGFDRNQAFHWWKRVYSGLVNPSIILPKEIGAAAGYEAIRLWETHSAIYASPMDADREREREALVSIAAAEATKLWAYTGRHYDKWGRLEASETAAATASRIFIQTYGYNSSYQSYTRFPRLSSFSRRNALGGRRAFTPNNFSTRAYRPPTPYNVPSVVGTLASPASSIGGNALNMSGMGAALPNSPFQSPIPPAASPMGIPSSPVGMEQGYVPPLADDFPNSYDDADDYEDRYEYGPYAGNGGGYGNSVFAGGIGDSAYDNGYRAQGIGVPFNHLNQGRNLGLGYGGLGSDNSIGFMDADMIPYGDSMMNPLNEGLGSYGNSMMNSPYTAGLNVYGTSAANPSNMVYDPILGPGIQGTYYPKMAQMQSLNGVGGLSGVGGRYGYPGAAVGLPAPPGIYSGRSRRGLRRSRSFNY